MIIVENLTKKYGEHTAIDRLNFHVRKGEVVGFLGPNGAGKSTTMKIITGFMAPSEGIARVGGFDVFENPIEVKKRIGYLPETPPVYADMLVRDYLTFVAQLKGVEGASLKTFVDRAIEKTHLGAVQKRLIQNLSKGFKQRVGIAQALVSNPEVLILDEPTVGLDPKQVAEIRDLIRELRGEHTVILSTHILPEVQATCERIIIINHGKIVAQDSLANLSTLKSGSRRVHLKVRKANADLQERLKALPGILAVVSTSPQDWQIDATESEDVIERVASEVIKNGAGLLEITSARADLEEIFLKLTYGNEAGGVA